MQLSPHGLLLAGLQYLQQTRGGGLVGCTTIGTGVSVGGRKMVGMFVGTNVFTGPAVRVGAAVFTRVASCVGGLVRVGPGVLVGMRVLVDVGVMVDVAVKVGGIGVKVGSSVAVGNFMIRSTPGDVAVGATGADGALQPMMIDAKITIFRMRIIDRVFLPASRT